MGISFNVVINEEIVKDKKVFVVHCAELGVTSQGENIKEAEKNIKEAVSLYLEENREEMQRLKEQEILIEKEKIMAPLMTRIFL